MKSAFVGNHASEFQWCHATGHGSPSGLPVQEQTLPERCRAAQAAVGSGRLERLRCRLGVRRHVRPVRRPDRDAQLPSRAQARCAEGRPAWRERGHGRIQKFGFTGS